ncbi:MAG: ABC transporter permease subunit [Azospirillaceae bacterium]
MSDIPEGKHLAEAGAVKGRSLWNDAWYRLMRNKAAVGAMIVLAAITVFCVVGPYLTPHELGDIDWGMISHPPTWEGFYIFGTDGNGRDLLTRVMHGGQVSLMVGVVATMVALVIGVAYGATAGFFGGRVDTVMMRVVDVLYSIPFMFFVIMLIVVFGRNFILIFVAIGAVEWLDMARIVRGQTLSVRRREFIEAAHAAGVSNFAIIRRHIIPNTLGPVIVFMTLTVPKVILLESFLSFLGLGTQEPNTSWGVLISNGAGNMESSPWMLIFPAIFLAATLYCLNFIGDGLRDALDPKDR